MSCTSLIQGIRASLATTPGYRDASQQLLAALLMTLAFASFIACTVEEIPVIDTKPIASADMTSTSRTPQVSVGKVTFKVALSATTYDQSKGLSGRDSLAPRSGMLFVYRVPQISIFWMKGMRFPLDFIWIDRDCQVADTLSNADVPASDTSNSQLPLYRSAVPVLYGLEVNAGEIARLGIKTGDRVVFSYMPTEDIGC